MLLCLSAVPLKESVNYDQIVDLDDASKLCPKILFHDSSSTFCEIFLLLTPYVSDMILFLTILLPCSLSQIVTYIFLYIMR